MKARHSYTNPQGVTFTGSHPANVSIMVKAAAAYEPPSDERRALGERFEAACEEEARLYAEGKDTTAAAAEVDRLLEQLRAKGWA